MATIMNGTKANTSATVTMNGTTANASATATTTATQNSALETKVNEIKSLETKRENGNMLVNLVESERKNGDELKVQQEVNTAHPLLNDARFTPELINAIQRVQSQNPNMTFLTPEFAVSYHITNLPCTILFAQDKKIYALGEILGQGSQGRVNRVFELHSKKFYAAKFHSVRSTRKIPGQEVEAEKEIEFLKTTGKYISQLDYKGRICIIEELADGDHLFSNLHQKVKLKQNCEAEDLEEWVDMARAALKALDEMHGFKIFHRDLRADNIIYTKDKRCVIIDPGFAEKSENQDKHLGDFVAKEAWGRSDFTSPDILENKEKAFYCRSTDLFSMGKIFNYSLKKLKENCKNPEIIQQIENLNTYVVKPMMLTIKENLVESLPSTMYFIEELGVYKKAISQLQKAQPTPSLQQSLSTAITAKTANSIYDLIKNGSSPETIIDLFKQNPSLRTLGNHHGDGLTPFLYAVKLGRKKIIAALIKHDRSLVFINNPIKMAADYGRAKIAELLLETAAAITLFESGTYKLKHAFDDIDLTATLKYPIRNNDLEMIKIFINAFKKKYSDNQNNETYFQYQDAIQKAIQYAIREKRPEVAWLLSNNCSVQKTSDYFDILFLAMAQENKSLVAELIKEVDRAKTGFLATPCKQIIDKGKNARSLLHFAAKYNHLEAMTFFLKMGATHQTNDNKGYQSLHLAAVSGNLDCVNLLLANGADLNAKTKTGETAFELAAKRLVAIMLGQEKGNAQELLKVICLLYEKKEAIKKPTTHDVDIITECIVRCDNIEALHKFVMRHKGCCLLEVMVRPPIEKPKLAFLEPSILEKKAFEKKSLEQNVPLQLPKSETNNNQEKKSNGDNNPVSVTQDKKSTSETPLIILDRALLAGIYSGSVQTLKVLLALKPDTSLNNPICEGKTLLHLAAQYNLPSIVELLIARGADINQKSTGSEEYTPWQFAIIYRAIDVAKYLFNKGKVKINGSSALDFLKCCISMNNIHEIKEWYPRLKKYLPERGEDGVTLFEFALKKAGESKDESIAEYLLDQNIDVNPKPMESKENTSQKRDNTVHLAIKCRLSASLLKKLISKFPLFSDIQEIEDENGCTPLLLAVVAGRIDLVDLLLSSGANSALLISKGNVNPYRFSGRPQGILPAEVTNPDSVTAIPLNGLCWVSEYNLSTILARLLTHKTPPSPDLRAVGQLRALDVACEKRNKSIVKLLLNSGADPNNLARLKKYLSSTNTKDNIILKLLSKHRTINKYRNVPRKEIVEELCQAIKSERSSKITELLEYDPTLINDRDKNGVLPTVYSLFLVPSDDDDDDEDDDKKQNKEKDKNKLKDNETLSLLLKFKPDLTLKTFGKTFLEIAIENRNEEHTTNLDNVIHLFNAGANLFTKDASGNTPLHKIVLWFVPIKVLNRICSANPHPNLFREENNDRKTVLDLAIETQKNIDVFKLLWKQNAAFHAKSIYHGKSCSLFLWQSYGINYIELLLEDIKLNQFWRIETPDDFIQALQLFLLIEKHADRTQLVKEVLDALSKIKQQRLDQERIAAEMQAKANAEKAKRNVQQEVPVPEWKVRMEADIKAAVDAQKAKEAALAAGRTPTTPIINGAGIKGIQPPKPPQQVQHPNPTQTRSQLPGSGAPKAIQAPEFPQPLQFTMQQQSQAAPSQAATLVPPPNASTKENVSKEIDKKNDTTEAGEKFKK